MTEALNTHGQGQPTIVEAPRPSSVNRGDLSASISHGRNLSPRQIAARLVLAGAMLGSGKLALDATPTSGQEPSAAPSFGASFEPTPSITPDPITGLLPCPSPTPEPEESIIPDRTLPPDIGKIPNGEVLFAQGQNSNGETVFVLAQGEPSAIPSAPASIAPDTSASPDPLTGVANPDCINLEEYTLQWLLDQEYKPVNDKQFMKIVKRNAAAILEHEGKLGLDFLDTEEEIVQDYKDYVLVPALFRSDIDHIPPELFGTMKKHMELASAFARTNIKIANAYREVGNAVRGLCLKYLDLGSKDGKVRDRILDKLIKEFKG